MNLQRAAHSERRRLHSHRRERLQPGRLGQGRHPAYPNCKVGHHAGKRRHAWQGVIGKTMAILVGRDVAVSPLFLL